MEIQIKNFKEPTTFTDKSTGELITSPEGYWVVLTKKKESGESRSIALSIPDEIGESLTNAEAAIDEAFKIKGE